MPKIRVLVVDDSVTFRQMLSTVLSNDPACEVVATAPNGRLALAKIPHVNPQVVILDVEMGEMDGLETLRRIKAEYPTLPVIMFSAVTERCASVTLEALSLGARDYVTKPAGMKDVSASIQYIREEMVAKIKAHVGRANAPKVVSSAALSPVLPLIQRHGIDAVVVGISSGGPPALATMVPLLPADLPVPVLIVQHMPPFFTAQLAARLDSLSRLRVIEGALGMAVERGRVYLAPGNFHMAIARDAGGLVLRTHQGMPENSCRPSVDVLFRTAAETFGPRCLAVVMTGMGNDGLRGCQAIRAAGGQVIAQNESSSLVWGMPGAVARAGLAEKLLSPEAIATEIVLRGRRGRSERPPA